MIEFLARHEMTYWADRFEQIAKALKSPDAAKAVALKKKIPKENIVRLVDTIASKDQRDPSDKASLLMKLTDEVTQAFAQLRLLVKGQAKKANAAKPGSGRPHLKGGNFGPTAINRGGASAPRRSSSD